MTEEELTKLVYDEVKADVECVADVIVTPNGAA